MSWQARSSLLPVQLPSAERRREAVLQAVGFAPALLIHALECQTRRKPFGVAIPFHQPPPHRFLYLAQPVVMPKKASFPAFYSPAFLEAATACSGKSPEAGDSTEVLPSKSILPSQRLTVNLSPMKCDAQELSLYWDGKGIWGYFHFGDEIPANLQELQALHGGCTTR